MLKVYPLKNYPKYISEINKIVFDEFKYFFPNLSMEDFEKSVNEKLNIDKLPIFYVAFDDNKLIGCFALREYDIKVSKDFSPPLKEKYSPWLGSIVVYPHYRGQGYGKALEVFGLTPVLAVYPGAIGAALAEDDNRLTHKAG